MLFLASQSPRRRQLLQQLGVEFGILEVDVPEVPQPDEAPADYVRRVAREKAGAGLLQVVSTKGAKVIGADTEVILGGEVFGKPVDDNDAARMLRALSGRTHDVVSAVYLVDASREAERVSLTKVRFATLDDRAIAAYIASGEHAGKAGAYAIQGRAAAFVERIEGSYTGVMGLPLFETAALLREMAP